MNAHNNRTSSSKAINEKKDTRNYNLILNLLKYILSCFGNYIILIIVFFAFILYYFSYVVRHCSFNFDEPIQIFVDNTSSIKLEKSDNVFKKDFDILTQYEKLCILNDINKKIDNNHILSAVEILDRIYDTTKNMYLKNIIRIRISLLLLILHVDKKIFEEKVGKYNYDNYQNIFSKHMMHLYDRMCIDTTD